MAQTSTSATSEQLLRQERRIRDLRFLDNLHETLAGCRNEAAVYSSAVHRITAVFAARNAGLLAYDPISDTFDLVHCTGVDCEWDSPALRAAVGGNRTVTEGDYLAAPVFLSGGGQYPAESHVWGVIAVRRPGRTFSSSERQLLRSAAQRLAWELDRRRANLLDDVLDTLARKTKPIDVYTHGLRELRRFLRFDHSATIMTLPRGTAQATVRVEKMVGQRGKKETLTDSSRRGRTIRLTAAQTEYLHQLRGAITLRQGEQGWIQPDGAAGLWRVLSLHEDGDEQAILCYPLIFGGQMLGLLRLAAKRCQAFDPVSRHEHVLDRFARLLAMTLYRSELYYQSDRQLQAIKQMGQAMTEPRSVEEVCRRVLQLALRALYVDVGAVGLLQEDGNLELVAYQGLTEETPPALRIGEGIAGSVVQTGASRAVPDVSQAPAYVVFNARVRSELAVPIVYNREVIGFLAVESFEVGRFREEDEEVISFLEALANQAAIAIKTAQLHLATMKRLDGTMRIDPALSTAGLQDLLVDELRDKINQLGTLNESLAMANRAKSDFLARMSHDLRGPLNVIIGLANLLTDPAVEPTLPPEKQRESLRIIHSSGEVLSSLIGNILDLSALEADKEELSVAPVDAQAAFRYLRAMTGTLATEHQRQLDIRFTIDPAVAAISVDEQKFFRIMINLISNAVKFTTSGGMIEVWAGIDQEEDAPPALHIVVADSGIGIPPEFHEIIFEPFRRLDGSQNQGSGLGLAVVRQLVDLHGGRVSVESRPGAGAQFHVTLPQALSIPQTSAGLQVSPAEDLDAGVTYSRGLVLVVEDTDAHMDLMRLAVTSRGYRMQGVRSAEEAMDWLADHRPDVILLDMQLPGMDGFALAACIRARIETHDVPLIAVTADALSTNEDRALASGCDAYLTKPIDIATLLSTIDAVLARPV